MTDQSDARMARALRSALRRNPKVSASRIKVICRSGIVTLTGCVPRYAAKLAAVLTARAMPWAMSVSDEIRVAPRTALTDREVSERVVRALDRHTAIPSECIVAHVRKGRCTLSGHVPTATARDAVAEVALSCAGVRTVRNLLVTAPSIVARDLRLVRRVREMLEGDKLVATRRIAIRAIGGQVVLTGSVRSVDERLRAGGLSAAAPGARGVTNKLRVGKPLSLGMTAVRSPRQLRRSQ